MIEADSPAEALRKAPQAARIDLLLTDVVMPGMTGPMLLEALGQLDLSPPTVFTSGYTDDEVVRRGVVTGEATFLGKPFTPGQLLETVHAALSAD